MSTRLKKNLCRNWKLYVVTETAEPSRRTLDAIVADAVSGGADVIQLRDKKISDEELTHCAKRLLPMTRKAGVPLIINDRLDVAKAAGADGLHLGQEDGTLRDAKNILGEEAILGRSTHSAHQALEAQAEGFDYIGVGPVFATPTKPTYTPVGLDLVRFAAARLRVPFVAIGGITGQNAKSVREAGARTIAVVRAVVASPEAGRAARELKEVMQGL